MNFSIRSIRAITWAGVAQDGWIVRPSLGGPGIENSYLTVVFRISGKEDEHI